ncbi:copper homeostasis membrane protein CopD [Escherichia marmotae]|uniref:copper homeostasis membrane protein CopD n=1 Tax=Escherichia marmotae TaxID=1499973 RepID=UPI001C9A3FD9|nr:copper homeostasis membrane protein CopD [Escherichia marmotae]MBY7304388.1 copper homeostasis membrane protein CopD [Escherichia marmotae]
MLAFTWVALRFIHFISLMLVFGFAMYGAWLAPVTIRRLLTKRFLRIQQHAAVWSLSSAAAMFAVQGGLMGAGWPDVVSLNIWLSVLQTQFGGVWIWQIVLALVTLTVAMMQPRNMPRLLFMLTTAQFILMAGVGHATLNEGLTAKIHQTNHAVHLICAAAWFGGLLPVVWCMQLVKGRWRREAIHALMRFSRCGHFAVIGVLGSGVLNTLLITGFSPTLATYWGQLLLLKVILVMVMVAIALANRYVLVPRMGQDEDRAAPWFVWMTKLEWAIGAVVLVIISLLATLEPF